MDFKRMSAMLGANPELAKSLKDAYLRNADAEEISDILASAGADAATVDELLTEHQRRRGIDISKDDLDEETLRMVAGGDEAGLSCTQADDCVKHFTEEWMWDGSYEKCEYWMWCDDYFCGTNNECAATTISKG